MTPRGVAKLCTCPQLAGCPHELTLPCLPASLPASQQVPVDVAFLVVAALSQVGGCWEKQLSNEPGLRQRHAQSVLAGSADKRSPALAARIGWTLADHLMPCCPVESVLQGAWIFRWSGDSSWLGAAMVALMAINVATMQVNNGWHCSPGESCACPRSIVPDVICSCLGGFAEPAAEAPW